MNGEAADRERFCDQVRRGETTKLSIGERQVFVGELGKFLANFLSTNVLTILLIVLMAVS